MPSLQLKQILLQQLRSLHLMGVQDIHGDDSASFDFSQFELSEASAEKRVASSPVGQTSLKTESASVVREQPVAPAAPTPVAVAPATPAPIPAKSSSSAGGSISVAGEYPPAVDSQQRSDKLEVLASEVANCKKCPELCGTRTKTVFGVGDAQARIVFLGEGPGANEDRAGEPFVGEAGKLLDKILTASKLSRDEVYILNTVKCRPPNNRNPLPGELENCRPYLDQQLDVIRPDYIVCLGAVAAKSLLDTKLSLGKLRKQFHQYRSSKVVVTYHPAYLLRTPAAKKNVWEDMKMLMGDMGVEL